MILLWVMQMKSKKVEYNWEQIQTLVNRLEHQIRKSGKKYDLILAVLRGGAIPAVMLSHKLDIDVAAIPAKNYRYAIKDKMGERRVLTGLPSFVLRTAMFIEEKDDWQKELNEIKKGNKLNQNQIIKNILIVDELVDSGETLVAVSETIKAAGWEFDIAVLVSKPQDLVKIKYYGDLAKKDDWLCMPWEEEASEKHEEEVYK